MSLSPQPLGSLHTNNFPALLDHLGISLAVTTYQAGKLVFLRADGATLNTHFRSFPKPMGLALQGDRLALGTFSEVWEYHNNPTVAGRREPAGRHDACFLPRVGYCTGDTFIHEMAWVEDTLVFVNTRFSCLSTLSPQYSFVPTWRPPFISVLAPEDRCHLNGLAVVEGQVGYVTALGATDGIDGWRVNKKDGGLLLEVPSGEVVARGLSMPHSPRWYREQLWVLESGRGGLGTIERATGRYQGVVELPGFTRGLDFCEQVAFVGLSQVRETATFSGLPLTERSQERVCGVWAVNLDTGEPFAWLEFQQGVQELFAVQVVPRRWPDLIHDDTELLAGSFVLPDEVVSEVQQALRGVSSPAEPS
jgi:uncharacterized protein (TIGR03032 family)